jgi:hypothetical protein
MQEQLTTEMLLLLHTPTSRIITIYRHTVLIYETQLHYEFTVWSDDECVLFQYFVFLFLLLCAELSVAVATLIYREEFLTGLENRLLNRFKTLYGRDSSDITQAIDQAQYTVSDSNHSYLDCISSAILFTLYPKRLYVSLLI